MRRTGLIAVLAILIFPAGAWAFGTKKAPATPSPGPSPSSSPSAAPSPASSEPAAARDALIWVAQPDGSKSCGEKAGRSLEDGAAPLKKLGVRVFSQKKTHDGMMHIQMCGAATGMVNAYQIAKKDLERAKSADYSEFRFPGKP